MLSHQYKNEFLAAAAKKYDDLECCDIFHLVTKSTVSSKILLLMWVFIYKLDDDSFLIKFKAWICVQEDLQDSTHHDIYAATLAARIFRALMVIAAAFDLEIFQFDTVNTFMNSSMKNTVYYKCLERFEKTSKCWLLQQALYEL